MGGGGGGQSMRGIVRDTAMHGLSIPPGGINAPTFDRDQGGLRVGGRDPGPPGAHTLPRWCQNAATIGGVAGSRPPDGGVQIK